MVSTVVVTGIAKGYIDKRFRLIETRNNDPFDGEKEYVSLIPVLYWTRDEFNPLNNVIEGTFVVIQGRLESDKEHGLYVLAENIHIGLKGEEA